MAGKGISINFLANVRDFLRGTDDVEKAFDGVSGSLDEVARDGDRSTEKLERSFKDLTRTVDRETNTAQRSMGRNFEKGTRTAKGELDELGREARQNAAETFSSFDGSVDSFADGIQGTLGGIVSSLGAVGAVAGAAGAIGIGLVTAELVKQQEKAEEVKAALTDAYRSAAEEGRDYLDEAQIIARANEIIFDPDRYKKSQEDAKALGVDVTTAIRAQAGDLAALDTISRIATQAEEERLRVMASDDGAAAALSLEVSALRGVADEYETLREKMNENSALAREAGAVKSEIEREQREQIKRTRDADQARYEALGRAHDEASSRGPIDLRTTLEEPDTDAVRRGIENSFERRPARVRARIVNRLGQEVI